MQATCRAGRGTLAATDAGMGGSMKNRAAWVSAFSMLAVSALATSQNAPAPGAAAPPPTVDQLIQRIESRSVRANKDGALGALAPDNLNKKRPPAPFNMTGTWFPDNSRGFRFGPPYPEFIGQAKADFETGQEMAKTRTGWRDAIGQCYPAGPAHDHDARVVHHDGAGTHRGGDGLELQQ